MQICPMVRVIGQRRFNICQILNKPSKNCQSFYKNSSQGGEISQYNDIDSSFKKKKDLFKNMKTSCNVSV